MYFIIFPLELKCSYKFKIFHRENQGKFFGTKLGFHEKIPLRKRRKFLEKNFLGYVFEYDL
jgi:hypothetical protein